MQPWSPLSLVSVTSATGNLIQLYPTFCTAGSGATTMGTQVRQSTEGVLYFCDIMPSSIDGGDFELWDIGGLPEGASNNTNTGTTLTNAFLIEQQAKFKARLIWKQAFKGDSGTTNKSFKQRVPVMWGLAGRYINTAVAVGVGSITVSIVASGCARKYEISG